jgi:hypothetical protein
MRPTVAAAGLALAAALAPLAGLAALVSAQEPPPVAESADGRILAMPFLGGRSATERSGCWVPGPGCPGGGAPPVLDSAALRRWQHLGGITVQNGGTRPTALLAAYLADVPGEECDGCQVAAVRCSPAIGPGETWRFPAVVTNTQGTTATIAAQAFVYSLNTRPARDYGPAFARYIEENGLPADASPAAIACQWAEPAPGATIECPAHSAWLAAFGGGATPSGLDLPIEPFRGEPVAAVVASPIELAAPTGGPARSVDRYAALSWDEATGGQPGAHVYYAPGAYLDLPDGFHSALILQNLGPACANVTVRAFQSGGRGEPPGGPATLRVPAGGRRAVDAALRWPLPSGATLQVEADQPLAVLLLNRGPATSSLSPALRERSEQVQWALPLAYQESRPEPLARAGAVRVGSWADGGGAGPTGLAADEGYGSYVSVFNPVTDTRPVRMRTQAPGRPLRDVLYPLSALAQTVFQLGFGLGMPGGPGWARFSVDGPNVYVANETLRSSSDVKVAYLESWMTPAWPYGPGAPPPRTVLLPDLGGPAIGAAGIAVLRPGTGVTNTLVSQLAIQNVFTATARVAIDSFASCGYAGTVEQSIDPNQAAWLPTVGLSGTALGANAAVLRVLDGNVAVMTELVRPERQPTSGYFPDLSSAWLGARFAHDLPAPSVFVTPTAVTVTLPLSTDDPPFVSVTPVHVSRLCHRLRADSNRPWLAGVVGPGNIPGGVTVLVTPRLLGPGTLHVGHLLVDSDPPGAAGLPQTVTVTVIGRGRPDPLYLPFAQKSRG